MRYRYIAKATALMLMIVMLASTAACATQSGPYKVALIVSSASEHHWENIIDGAQTAATRMEVNLVVYAPDEENGITLEMLPMQAVRDGADAILAATMGEEALVDAMQQVHLSVAAIGTSFSHPHLVTTILNDDAKMGQNIAKALASNLEPGDTILLLADNEAYRASEQREYNMRVDLDNLDVSVQKRMFSGDNREWAYRQAMQQMYLSPDLSAIVAFSANSTVGAAQAAEYLSRDITIIGTDVVPELIECIEDRQVTATIVRNSFGMGYLGVEYIVGDLRGDPAPRRQTLSSVVVTSDNLFTAEVEKIIFTFD